MRSRKRAREPTVMPPKSRKRRQSLEAAAKVREILKQVRLDQEKSDLSTLPTGVTSITEESMEGSIESGPSQRQPGPFQSQPGSSHITESLTQ